MSAEVFIGVEVSPSEIGIAMIPAGGTESISNDHHGIEALVSRLREVNPAVVVLAEGNSKSIHVTGALAAGSLPVVTISSRQIRDFATALGLSGDKVDASLLARFAQAARPSPKILGDQEALDIEALIQRRSQISQMITDENDRLQSAALRVRKDIESHIKWMVDRQGSLDSALAKIWVGSGPAAPVENIDDAEETDSSDNIGTSQSVQSVSSSSDGQRTGKKIALKFKKPKNKNLAALGNALKQKRKTTGERLIPSAPTAVPELEAEGSDPPLSTSGSLRKIAVNKGKDVNFECAACGTKKRIPRGPDGKIVQKETEGWKLMRDGEAVLKFCPRCASAGSVFQ